MGDDEEQDKKSLGNKVGDTVKNETSKQVKKGAKKAVEKLAKKEGAKAIAGHSIGAALAPILFWVVVVIVALIIIIGILMFFITMPGMVMEQLKALFKDVGNYLAAFFGADTTEQIDKVEVFATLDYLEEMGWDLKGEGFLTDYMTDGDLEEAKGDDSIDQERRDGAKLDKDVGVIRDGNDKVIKADADFIFMYMMSDNYCYTLKNENIVTQRENKPKGLLGWLETIGAAISTAFYKIENLIYGPLYDLVGVTDGVVETFGKGLICLYYDNGLGVEKNAVNMGSLANWDTIKMDVKGKKLSIAKNTFLNSNNPIEFSLDGWTGRYGMPLEFLLAIHKATMMPDLAYDMIYRFPTEVKVYLHNTTNGAVVGSYKTASGTYLSLGTLNEAFTGLEGSNFFSGIITWFDNLQTTDKEAQIAFKMGIEHSPDCTCEKGTVTMYTYGDYNVNGKPGAYTSINKGDIVADLSHSGDTYTATIKDGEDETEVSFDESDVVISDMESDEEVYTYICDACKKRITAIVSYCAESNDFHFQSYSPYIKSVTDHWYRDVTFVLNSSDSKQFVDYDYDYEAITKERWTLYETDDDTGEFKYYEVNSDGSLGTTSYTKEEAMKDGIKVAKKAKLVDLSDESVRNDLGWTQVAGSDSLWSAYEENAGNSASGYEPAYTEEQIAEETDDARKEVMKNIYANVNTSGNIVQTGEGMRSETNNEIKKMFLKNTYFRYDGTDQVAEAITQLRNENNIKYGPLTDNVIDTNYTTTVDGQTYSIKDVSGNVSLNQDSLNAFSILENEHTLDSDYIYRDFKELIVELGYFEKEELTDETPRVLEFLLPDIGSGGYPMRSIDKNENEFGTMLHSKGDIDANIEAKIDQMIQSIGSEIPEEISQQQAEKVKNNTHGLYAIKEKNKDLNSVQGVGDGSGIVSPASVSLEEFLTTTREMCEYMNQEGYDYCVLTGSGCHHDPHSNSCSLPITFEESKASVSVHNVCCATLVSWALQNVKVMPDSDHLDGANALAQYIKDNLDCEVIQIGQELEEGDILCYNGHIDMVGKKIDGGFEKYNGGHYIATGAKEYESKSAIGKLSGWPNDDRIQFALRIHWGNSPKDAANYEGYEGNDAVVSPVTGILLDYGTYDASDVDSISGLEYRVNTDLRYGSIYSASEEIPEGARSNKVTPSEVEPEDESEIQSDKVGYAKILVLDDETYAKFEKDLMEKTTFGAGSFLTSSGNYLDYNDLAGGNLNQDTIEDWSISNSTLYAYKKFAETYKIAGISGNIIYMDGFKCELPDEKLSGGDEEEGEGSGEDSDIKMAEQIPEGKKIESKDFFGEVTKSTIDDDSKQLDSKYEQDSEYKMASEKATDKVNAESTIKMNASTNYKFSSGGKDYIMIKEGTVIGRTITDKELITKIRSQDEAKYKEYRPDTEEGTDPEDKVKSKVMGNYLRIYMKDSDDTTIENVEDYMKLDENDPKNMSDLDDEKFLYWMGTYCEGGHLEDRGGKYYSLPVDLGDGVGSTHYYGLTYYNIPLGEKLGYKIPDWSADLPLDMLSDIYVNLIEEQKAQIEKELGSDVPDGYKQAFISILHNYGKFTKRGDEYKANGSVSESTWTTYEGTQFVEALTKRRVAEWILITEGKYMNYNDGNTGEIDFTAGGKYSEETPFTDFLKDHNVNNVTIKSD